jgi:hypothetical protein
MRMRVRVRVQRSVHRAALSCVAIQLQRGIASDETW